MRKYKITVAIILTLCSSGAAYAAPDATAPIEFTKATWDTRDQSLRPTRLYIDKLWNKPKQLEGILQKNKAKAATHADDVKAVFAWAYAAWRLRGPNMPFDRQRILVSEPSEALYAVQSKSYEYVRLRFLMNTWLVSPREFLPLGERLLRKDPKDDEVRFCVVKLFDVRNSRPQRAKALAYTQLLIRKHPKVPNYRSLLGLIHFKVWNEEKTPQSARATVRAYQDYLRIAPPNAPLRKEASEIIKLVQTS